MNPSWYLTNVFAGFEIWNGGVGLEIKDFGVTVPVGGARARTSNRSSGLR